MASDFPGVLCALERPETSIMTRPARLRCPDCSNEYLVTFSCKTRHFCPSCHAKRREAWSIWLGLHLLLRVPHRQVVFTIPKMVRPFFRYRRGLLSDLCLCAVRATGKHMEIRTDRVLMPGVVAVIQTFGNRLNFHPHLHMPVTEAGTSRDGDFYPVPIFNDAAITRIFASSVLHVAPGSRYSPLSPTMRSLIESYTTWESPSPPPGLHHHTSRKRSPDRHRQAPRWPPVRDISIHYHSLRHVSQSIPGSCQFTPHSYR
jgi:hypothetical protein